ncbi:thiamine pyrophosphate-dependent enzyme [Micromonospora halotolerans]|uniref:Thiamine pyrophosphate-dependent enzyme n=1 Tax=Micromonospora halotolerans TaxID=709879 RepID=A0ABY9ZSK8_9ACTN|nr:thiamine pyrophosphate-dependent enzyme [Micromonospora halotolerans]WNM37341.1 thiamine pyrophosphate-dependent enzyme [Micromonospora halotolerans]
MLSDVTTPQDLDDRFRAALTALGAPAQRRDLGEPLPGGGSLTGAQALALFDAQLTSRLLDLAGRWLRSFGEGYYTIGSAGHEGNAAVAAALRPTDPALLHYRSGAFYCLRAAQAAGRFPVGAEVPDADVPEPTGAAARIPDPRTPGDGDADADSGAPDGPPEAAAPDAPVTPGESARAGATSPYGGAEAAGDGAGPSGGSPAADDGAASLPTGAGVAVDTDGAAIAGVPEVPLPEPDDAYAEAARDVLRGMVASAAEPIAGGRHKVFGRADLAVIPTTSTIASHLPRAVGLGLALERLRRGGRRADGEPDAVTWPPDAIVVCSFGDASVNHATATAAFNTAGWYDHTGLRIPVLFVCEDNGLGISVRSPQGWVAATLRARPGTRYFSADGTDVAEAYRVAGEAAAWVRRHRRPAVLHLTTVRLMGHAGADAETAYRSPAEIAADLARDPLLATARRLVEAGCASGEELLARYDERGWQIRRLAEEVLDEPKLTSPVDVVAELAPRRPVRISRAVADAATRAAGPDAGARAEAFGGKLPELAGPLTLAQSINAALADGMLDHPGVAVFGEDVAAKGGVYGVTKGLRDRFGAARVFDTLLDETSILGLALGAGVAGMLPVPEIQYLAYLHNAEDQLRGEAATMRFFSRGAFRNPMVVRVAGLAYQEGFGGHFHNDNSVAVLRDVPGLVVAVPARPDDAAPMLRTCLAAAAVDGAVSVFLEPIALYHTRDLYTEGDGEWLAEYAEPGAWAARHVPIGRARVYGVGSAEDLTIITFGNGVRMSLRAAATLADEGVGSRVVDLRWLAPLPVADIIREAAATGRVLVVDETRRSGGVGEGVIAALVDGGYVGTARRVAGLDSFVPLGPAARQVLVSEDAITEGARTLLAR